MSFVIDASVAAAWFLPDEFSEASSQLARYIEARPALVPDLFFHEMRSVLLRAYRRGRLTETLLWDTLNDVAALPLQTVLTPDAHLVITLAIRHGLTTYDATYLTVAILSGVPLATFDASLQRAARAEGVLHAITQV
jgi:predicted nucleic acid-binding protein